MSFDARKVVIDKYKGYTREDLTIDDTVGGVKLTESILNTLPPPKRVYITIETARCRFTYDGTAPLTTLGHILDPMDQVYIEGLDKMRTFRVIKTGATSAKGVCTYER